MGKNITVLGAGAWGTAFGQVLADAGNTVTMWAKEQQIVEGIRDHHHNAVRLPSVEKLPDNMTATGDRAEAVKNADIVVVAIAAQSDEHIAILRRLTRLMQQQGAIDELATCTDPGRIVAAGRPAEVAENPHSLTATYLKAAL